MSISLIIICDPVEILISSGSEPVTVPICRNMLPLAPIPQSHKPFILLTEIEEPVISNVSFNRIFLLEAIVLFITVDASSPE